MERRHSRRGGSETLCFIALCTVCLGALVLATPGDDYLNDKESRLATIAVAVQSNDAQKCELLKNCTVTTCSRNTCLPQVGDVKEYTCMSVDFNKYCNASAPGCHDKNYDYTRSFVRTAVNTDFNSDATTIGTCAQRALDPVFKNVSTPDSLLRFYFGANDGSYRAFPGSDEDVNNPECGSVKFDTRLRPWYRTSTSVPRAIAILIDAGQSMDLPILQGQGSGTVLDNAKSIVKEFLQALNSEDSVNIIMFGAKATPLSPSMVPVQMNSTTSIPELDSLWQSLAEQTAGDQPGTSDIAQGIDVALQNFGNNYADSAKIILVFTDGGFATGNSTISVPVTNLTSLNVKVFVYKIPHYNDGMLFIANTSFANQLCGIGGSFEVISSDLPNPLLALNSFFTFSAALQAAVSNNSADYSPIYEGYEEAEGNLSTISRPIFGTDGTFLGVVGMDLYINDLGSLTDSVLTAVLARSVGKVFDTSNFLLTSANCSIETALPPADPCDASVPLPPNGGFCYRTDQTSTIVDLACCRSCATPRSDGTGKSVVLPAVLGTVGGILLVCLLVGLFLWLKRRDDDNERRDDVPTEFPGDRKPDGVGPS